MPAGAPGMEIVAQASRHLPVLFLSGNGQGGHGKKSGQAGKTGYGHAHCPSLEPSSSDLGLGRGQSRIHVLGPQGRQNVKSPDVKRRPISYGSPMPHDKFPLDNSRC